MCACVAFVLRVQDRATKQGEESAALQTSPVMLFFFWGGVRACMGFRVKVAGVNCLDGSRLVTASFLILSSSLTTRVGVSALVQLHCSLSMMYLLSPLCPPLFFFCSLRPAHQFVLYHALHSAFRPTQANTPPFFSFVFFEYVCFPISHVCHLRCIVLFCRNTGAGVQVAALLPLGTWLVSQAHMLAWMSGASATSSA